MQLHTLCGWEGNCNSKMSAGWNFCPYWSLGQKDGNFTTQSNALMSATVLFRQPLGGTKVRNRHTYSILGLLMMLYEAHDDFYASIDLLT